VRLHLLQCILFRRYIGFQPLYCLLQNTFIFQLIYKPAVIFIKVDGIGLIGQFVIVLISAMISMPLQVSRGTLRKPCAKLLKQTLFILQDFTNISLKTPHMGVKFQGIHAFSAFWGHYVN
ncbi:MAG: hypothetical protein IKU09_08770, partial [Firmicutes bacterium]|nr:hypothetical protein [Bacillota bacterium]